MIRKITKFSEEENLVVQAIKERIEANKKYLDKEAVEFVINKLESGNYDKSIMTL